MNLREARLYKDLSQGQLARLAGLSQAIVSSFEHGVREPSPQSRQKLERALGVQNLIEWPKKEQDK